MSSSSQEMSKEAKEMVSQWEEVEGTYLPVIHAEKGPWKEHISNVRQMKLRSDDVFICAYPKAGTHWLWEVTSMLILGKAEYENRPKEQLMIDFTAVSKLDQIPSPRILNTHLPFSMLPVPEMKAKGVKVLHVYRNPKDIVVSFYHMEKRLGGTGVKEFKPFFEAFVTEKAMFGNYFSFLKQMNGFEQNNPEVPVMNLSFEDMKKNPVEKVKELAKFLGLEVSDSLCEEIEEACRFDNMKKQASQKMKFASGVDEPAANSGGDDARHSTMYRKGKVGDWKNHLTVAMSEKMDQLIKEKMEGLPYTLHLEEH